MFKLVVYTFKALHGSALTYIQQLIRPKPQSNYNLRLKKTLTARSAQQDQENNSKQGILCSRPDLWNALPDELRALDSLKTFMARLKTYYFKLAFSFKT